MKNYVVSVVAIFSFLVIFGVSTNAQQPACVTAQIPFTFTAMNKVHAEGNYTICPSSSIQRLFSLEGSSGKTLGFIKPLTIDSAESQRLVFNRYGNSYFLSEVRTLSIALELDRSKAEKELRRGMRSHRGGLPTTVTVALSPARSKTKS